MKEFFWAIIAIYVLLYFYAAWLYEGFNLAFATGLFLLVCGHLFWWRKRKNTQRDDEQGDGDSLQTVASPDVSPLSIWRSPLPYMVIIAIVVIAASQWR